MNKFSKHELSVDPLSEEFHENFQPSSEHVLSSLDGDVNGQGIKINHRDWLDMGSESWVNTPENVKAAAFQAALATGWDVQQIKLILLQHYKHLKESTVNATIAILEEAAKKYPLAIEDVSKRPPIAVKINKR